MGRKAREKWARRVANVTPPAWDAFEKCDTMTAAGQSTPIPENYVVFRNSIYQVWVRKMQHDGWPEMIWLSIKRNDRESIVEGNRWHDNFWGCCSCKKCGEASGKNWLGKLLMFRRKELTIQ